MTKDNIELDKELIVIDDHINAYIGIWFDVKKRFGIEIEDTAEYVNLYANYYPEDDKLDIFYIHHDSDGGEIANKSVDVSESEKS